MKKPTLILLHGWSISPHNEKKWKTFRDTLSQEGIDSLFLKLPGFSEPLLKPWTLQEYVLWLEKKLEGKENILLLGHSFGGQLAIRYTSGHSTQIKKLILIASSGIRDMSMKARLKRFIFLILAKTGKLFFSHPKIKKLFYTVIGEHDYQEASKVMKVTMQNVLSDQIVTNLAQIECPVQLIWGSNDSSTPYKNTQFLKQNLKNVRLCTIKDARHSPHFTAPKEVVNCIADFIT